MIFHLFVPPRYIYNVNLYKNFLIQKIDSFCEDYKVMKMSITYLRFCPILKIDDYSDMPGFIQKKFLFKKYYPKHKERCLFLEIKFKSNVD